MLLPMVKKFSLVETLKTTDQLEDPSERDIKSKPSQNLPETNVPFSMMTAVQTQTIATNPLSNQHFL